MFLSLYLSFTELAKFGFDLYYTLDSFNGTVTRSVMNTNHVLQIKQSNISVNGSNNTNTNKDSLFIMKPAIINSGVCFETGNDSISLELHNVCTNRDCLFAAWIKYTCKQNKNRMILNTPFISIWCYKNTTENTNIVIDHPKIAVLIDSCPMLINTKNGFWIHFAYLRKDERKEIFVDGQKVELIEDCNIAIIPNAEQFVVGKSNVPTCIDEIVMSRILPSFDNVKDKILQMHSETIYGRFTPIFFYWDDILPEKIFLTYVFENPNPRLDKRQSSNLAPNVNPIYLN